VAEKFAELVQIKKLLQSNSTEQNDIIQFIHLLCFTPKVLSAG